MPESGSASKRRHVHTRSIRVDAYARTDGLWDLEAVLVDTKGRDFPLATGVRAAGDPVHEMHLKITIDTRLNVVDAQARSAWVPYPGHCETIGPDYSKLIGLNLRQEFRRHVRERLGGTLGCTHMTELATVLPTAAIQAFAGEVFKTRDEATAQSGAAAATATTATTVASTTATATTASDEPAQPRKPWQLDRCHALRADAAAVQRYYPIWFRPGASSGPESDARAGTAPGESEDRPGTPGKKQQDPRGEG